MLLYAALLILLDYLSDGWSLSALIVIPILLVAEVIYILTMPFSHRKLLSTILLVVSVVLIPVAGIAASFIVGGFIGEPADYAADYRFEIIAACFLPSLLGIAQFIYFEFIITGCEVRQLRAAKLFTKYHIYGIFSLCIH
ncbi:MAG: hypothetical protein JWN82_615 [Candidatus Saccharibacteria bacterium]|nr:hypothetical protein [Candidatus Saccharibacteria bacterium]